MTNRHEILENRYKDLTGKIIALKDGGIMLAADIPEHLSPKDLDTLNKFGQNTDFAPEYRLRWLKVSTPDPDRAGDEMVISGVETDNFLRNPQFLWSHGQTSEPVHTLGKIVKLVQTSNALYALAQYTEPLFSELADRIYQLDCAGFMPANSIGFRPIEWEPNDLGGYRFTKWELIEVSKVELPCNPYAVDDGAPGTPSRSLSLREAAEMI